MQYEYQLVAFGCLMCFFLWALAKISSINFMKSSCECPLNSVKNSVSNRVAVTKLSGLD